MKKLFKNYNLELSKNERKVLISFCKKILTQVSSQEGAAQYQKTFESIITKLSSNDEIVRFSKDEKNKLKMNLKENLTYFEKEIKKAWFIKKWIYKSMYGQYRSIFENHFND